VILASAQFVMVLDSSVMNVAISHQLSNPHGLDTDLAGNVYVAEYGNTRIQKFKPAE
jgi:DNA-binding beta-propeller fold protein YncE